MNKSNHFSEVVTFGVNHYNTLGQVRALGEAGIRSDLILIVNPGEKPFVQKSRYINRFFIVKSEIEGLEVLLREYKNRTDGKKTIVMPTYDTVVGVLDENYDTLKEHFVIPSCGDRKGGISYFLEKENMREIAIKAGFNSPKTWVISYEGPDDIPHEIVYPCMIKTMHSLIGGKDLTIYNNRKELELGLSNLSKKYKEIQIQEYIEKDLEIQILGCSYGKDHYIASCLLEKILLFPPHVGNTAIAHVHGHIEKYVSIETLNKFFELIDYKGLFSIEFLIKDGKAYFLEINLRNDGHGYVPTYGGINLPAIYYNAVKYGKMPRNESIIIDYTVVVENNLLGLLKLKEITHSDFIQVLRKSDLKLIMNSKDRKPAIYFFKNLILHKILKILKLTK